LQSLPSFCESKAGFGPLSGYRIQHFAVHVDDIKKAASLFESAGGKAFYLITTADVSDLSWSQ